VAEFVAVEVVLIVVVVVGRRSGLELVFQFGPAVELAVPVEAFVVEVLAVVADLEVAAVVVVVVDLREVLV